LHDDALPGEIADALEQRGVLVFRDLHLDPETQVAVGQRLGDVDLGVATGGAPGTMLVTLDRSKSAQAEYLRGTFQWHMDGCTLPHGQNPQAATMLSAVALADSGGETEFASTYRAFDELSPDEKEHYRDVRVVHSVAATQRFLTAQVSSPSAARPARGLARDHPLIWHHRSGRRSLVLGATTDRVIGMNAPTGRALLDDLLERATTPDRVYRHRWSVGDMVIWDNRGLLHRVEPYDFDSPREMVRTTLLGDEPIE
jgi:alpha-ketoglutarate-dependent taurine dioxygenase